MSLTEVCIQGYRGFRTEQTLRFAIPDGALGSGLTVITGPNNGGKSSVLECLKARAGDEPPSFTTGVRNASTDFVIIKLHAFGQTEATTSIRKGSSEARYENRIRDLRIFYLPSRRSFDPYFGKSSIKRDQYINNEAHKRGPRPNRLENFFYRLFNILENPAQFNELLFEVLPDKPEWTIDQNDQGSFFLKFSNAGATHSSDGLGEGIVSLFSIVDAFHDSAPGDVIVIDEPELSLHPSLQRRLSSFLNNHSTDRQVIIATHSPYFITQESLANGGALARVVGTLDGSKIFQLSPDCTKLVLRLGEGNKFNPHIFGLDAKELFFQEERIVLLEGQEDVVFFPEILQQLGLELNGNIFGWGVGGAENMPHICQVLSELGYQRVAGVLDADKEGSLDALRKQFPQFHFSCIAAADIRTKEAVKERSEKKGLLDRDRKIRDEFAAPTVTLLQQVNEYLSSELPNKPEHNKNINGDAAASQHNSNTLRATGEGEAMSAVQIQPTETDELAAALAWHDGDAIATIRTLLDDCRHLRERLALAEISISLGFTRGWRPTVDESAQPTA